VDRARRRQKERFAHRKRFYCNGQMGPKDIRKFCALDQPSQALLEQAVERLGLSARAYHRILKIGRTIADLDDQVSILPGHIAEAVQYRRLERKK
jgi:magnesium chelatase family protein